MPTAIHPIRSSGQHTGVLRIVGGLLPCTILITIHTRDTILPQQEVSVVLEVFNRSIFTIQATSGNKHMHSMANRSGDFITVFFIIFTAAGTNTWV